MLRQPITYTNFNGETVTKNYYFNLSRIELLEMMINPKEDPVTMMQRIIDSNDNTAIYNVFKDFVLKSYGVKSEDGEQFIKSPELANGFLQSAACDELFMMFIKDANFAADFLKAIFPSDWDGQN